ncbi:MAG: PAS domain-containing protein, partial [Xanthomonadales bacterium]|nr:PAS domain-containing protein [Xanthomonadales bacterium]
MPEVDGTVLVLEADGRIAEVVCDGLGLGLAAGGRVDAVVLADEADKYARFLAAARDGEPAFDWAINADAGSGPHTLHFAAFGRSHEPVLCIARDRAGLAALAPIAASRLPPPTAPLVVATASHDDRAFEEMARLTNELAASERRQVKLNARLERTHQQLQVLYQALPVGVFQVDGEGRVVQANARFSQLSGVGVQQVWFARIDADEHAARQRQWLRLQQEPHALDLRAHFRGGDGVRRHLHIRLLPLRTSPTPGFVGMAEDLAPREQAEAQQRELARHRAIHDLSAGLAQHLNNLMAVALGNAELLAHALADNAPLRAAAARGLQATELAATLTRRLMAYAGISLQSMEPVSVDDELRAIIATLDASQRTRLQLTLQAGTAAVRMERGSFRECIGALLDNAFVALADADGGGVRVCTGLETDAESQAWLHIEVADDGPGMDAETA